MKSKLKREHHELLKDISRYSMLVRIQTPALKYLIRNKYISVLNDHGVIYHELTPAGSNALLEAEGE